MCCNTGVTIDFSFYTGNFQCFVRMNTDPVVECYGNGTSPEEAEAIAAQTALEYLQTVTKK
jgi:dsRNA-specific ribonuclease